MHGGSCRRSNEPQRKLFTFRFIVCLIGFLIAVHYDPMQTFATSMQTAYFDFFRQFKTVYLQSVHHLGGGFIILFSTPTWANDPI